MQKLLLIAAAFFSLTASAAAQTTDKKEPEKPATTTVDAWRQAIPEAERITDTPATVYMEESKDAVETRETPQQIEKRILDLESRLTEAFKKSDSAALKYLLAAEFAATGTAETQPDKNRFIEWALKNPELKSYTVEKTDVRVFPSTAVVTIYYKQRAAASVGKAPAENDFVATNVWVRRGKIWQAVSRHVSPRAKL